MQERPSAIVTTGGTKEPIDDVRFITNFATGRFGHTIARELTSLGYSVTVLAPREVPILAGGIIDGVNYVNFTDTDSLKQAIYEQEKPQIIFHAAAVSDYRPKKVEGKMPSEKEKITIKLEKTPKILAGLREELGRKAFIVGFKLLSGSSRQQLVDAALIQNRQNHLNLTVANNLQDLHNGMHPVVLVTAEGGAIDLKGTREEVARNLVKFVQKRSQVTWYKTSGEGEKPWLETPSAEDKEKFADALCFAQETNLLYDTSGNISVRSGDQLIVSPRQLDKSKIVPEQAAVARVYHAINSVYYRGEVKSSIDTAVSDSLYRKYPDIKYMLHFHTPWGLAEATTTFPYPCGVKEETGEIESVLGDEPRDEFAVELLHHGFLVGLSEGGIERLRSEWEENVSEFRKHLVAVKQQDALDTGKLKPVFAGVEIVGVVLERQEGSAVYLGEKSRGKGVGKKIVEQLIQRQIPIQTIDDCGVVEFYRRFGFTGKKDQDGFYTFYPPKPATSDPIFERIDDWQVK
jgi:GNAT superfamily N-acetyltransferase